jgi:hypothetical protein
MHSTQIEFSILQHEDCCSSSQNVMNAIALSYPCRAGIVRHASFYRTSHLLHTHIVVQPPRRLLLLPLPTPLETPC